MNLHSIILFFAEAGGKSWDGFIESWYYLAIAVGIVVAAVIFRWFFIKWIQLRILKFTEKTKTEYDDMIMNAVLKPVSFVIIVVGIYFAIKFGTTYFHDNSAENNFLHFLNTALVTFFSLIIGWILWRLIDVLEIFLINFTAKTKSSLDDQLVPMVRKGCRILVICLTSLLVIENAGGSVSAIMAGLGVFALAFALAGKEFVSNLFGSVVIFIDRPFNIGDVVVIDGQTGTVREVGVRSTRIETFEKTEIVMPNKDVAHKRIENLSKRPKRRSRYQFCVAIDSNHDDIQKFLVGLTKYLNDQKDIDENPVVKITGFDDMGIAILIQYWIKKMDYALSLDINQDLVLKTIELSQKYNCPLSTKRIAQSAGITVSQLVQPTAKEEIAPASTEKSAKKPAKKTAKKAKADGDFQPTGLQEKYLKACIDNKDEGLTLKQLSKKSGVAYATIMKWRKNPHFTEWLDKQLQS